MAFVRNNMAFGRATTNAIANVTSPIMHFYISANDIQTTVTASGYFNSAADQLIVGDCIYIKPADNSNAFLAVTAVSPNVTVIIFA